MLEVKKSIEKINEMTTEELEEFFDKLIKDCENLENDIEELNSSIGKKDRVPFPYGRSIDFNAAASFPLGGAAGLLGGVIASMCGHEDKFVYIALTGLLMGVLGGFINTDKITEKTIKRKYEKLYEKLLIKDAIENNNKIDDVLNV